MRRNFPPHVNGNTDTACIEFRTDKTRNGTNDALNFLQWSHEGGIYWVCAHVQSRGHEPTYLSLSQLGIRNASSSFFSSSRRLSLLYFSPLFFVSSEYLLFSLSSFKV